MGVVSRCHDRVADASLALFQSWDCPVKTEGETLEHIGSYAGTLPFTGDGHLRPYSYGLLDQQVLQPIMPMTTPPKYPRFPGNVDGQPLSSFHAGSALSTASLESSCGSSSASPGSASSSYLYPPSSTTYSSNGSLIPHFSPAVSAGYTPPVNFPQHYYHSLMYDGRARTTSITSSSGMPPPSPSPGDQTSVSPSSRRNHPSTASLVPSYGYEAHRVAAFVPNPPSSSMLSAPRSTDSSYPMSSSASLSAYGPSGPSQGGEASTHHPTLSSQDNVPPFLPTRTFGPKVIGANGTPISVDIEARIDKGFFKSDSDWTCYRRNYFSVACSYSMKPHNNKLDPFSLQKSPREPNVSIQSFAVGISARVDSEDGKQIELVQHTPKRDKGPTAQPDRMRLRPHPWNTYGVYSEAGESMGTQPRLSSDYDTTPYAPTSPGNQQNQTIATFDRIQFKNATANNGKRRAAQQYFHIVVELYAETPGTPSGEVQWIKIASRISAPMVVRGRSPGHYSDDRRGSSTSMGPGDGSSGDSAGSQRDPHSGSSGIGRSGVAGMFTNPPRVGGGGSSNYTGHQASPDQIQADDLSDGSSTSSDHGKMELSGYERLEETVLTPEEEDNIENHEGYQYYPATLFEAPAISHAPRPLILSELQNPSRSDAIGLSSQRGTGYGGLAGPTDSQRGGFGRFLGSDLSSRNYPASQNGTPGGPSSTNNGLSSQRCGRFHGVDTSRGYYPETPAL
ncbi:MAG: hypothetical protein L6R37_000904 [Teloschistes peruensis]|nr:MAG: hypothetical protein L6R37_000904 [Teloschistes peruensis]